eukprot:CAMPEP_0182861030 /NCGR_PEP_ID=MMETSP0034_2-20130328/5266_1 /TAXON_ID=156128 /ORGANISM="Nephroselmis pyriformis, Strain CCMP717" /LENGTH=171 /DNA_ID=CAMNT_0024992917 /DNA_START=364 /DNA_END=875 /DNA_ORIENTATION=+
MCMPGPGGVLRSGAGAMKSWMGAMLPPSSCLRRSLPSSGAQVGTLLALDAHLGGLSLTLTVRLTPSPHQRVNPGEWRGRARLLPPPPLPAGPGGGLACSGGISLMRADADGGRACPSPAVAEHPIAALVRRCIEMPDPLRHPSLQSPAVCKYTLNRAGYSVGGSPSSDAFR